MLDTRKLCYFLKVCETGSINAAANSLYLSPQALSKSIESLEKDLGSPLFERSSRGLKLTESGELLFQEGSSIVNRFSDLERRVSDYGNTRRNTVSVTLYSGMMLQYPDQFFSDYVLSHTQTKFRFFSYMDNHHGRRHAYTGADVFFATSPVQPGDMKLTRTISRPLGVLVGQKHLLAEQKMIQLEDLRDENVFSLTSDLLVQSEIQDRLQNKGISFTSSLSDAEQKFTYDLVREGLGIAFFAGPQRMVPPGTVKVFLADSVFEWKIYIYTRKDGLSVDAAGFLNYILSYWDNVD